MPVLLEVENIQKSFAGQPVLRDIHLTVDEGEIVCLLGPSGCGKTTLLRSVAGLAQPDNGHIRYQSQDMARVPVHQRNFGFMFQEFALFPHRNVGQNIAFGLRMAGLDPGSIQQRVTEMLDLVNLAGYEGRSVFELSGGERQRVALARSLAPQPGLLLLDEPLGSLDRALRESLMVELRAILKDAGITALYVTHDQEEALAIADRVAVMNQGRFEQIAAPQALYQYPATVFVARFLGFDNLLPARIDPADPSVAHTPLGRLSLPHPAAPGHHHLLLRPESATILEVDRIQDELSTGHWIVDGVIAARSYRGQTYRVELEVGTAERPVRLNFELSTHDDSGQVETLRRGQRIRVGIDLRQGQILAGG